MKRSRFALWLVALASTGSALLVAEVLLRTLRPEAQQLFLVQSLHESERGKFSVYDEVLGWTGKPNVDGTYDEIDCHHHVQQNSYGFRGPGFPIERTAARRVVVLGDSFVWGLGVEEDELFTTLLMRNSHEPLEVINLGVSGYGTDQELLLWTRLGQRFRPDLVLLLVTPWTDLYDNLSGERYAYPKPFFHWNDAQNELELLNVPVPRRAQAWEVDTFGPVAPFEESIWLRWLPRSALASNAAYALAHVPSVRHAMELAGIVVPRQPGNAWEDHFFEQSPDAETSEGWMLMGQLLSAFAASVRQTGAALAVVIVPTPLQVYPELWSVFEQTHPRPVDNPLDPQLPARLLTEMCYQRGIRVIDLQPALAAAGRSEPYLYFKWNMHWTALGHRVVAAALQQELANP